MITGKSSMSLNLVSPTRGCRYTLAEVLKKGLVRASLTYRYYEIEALHECFYGSSDISLVVDGFGPSESRWTESANFIICGEIPLHTTEGGRIEIGYRCGCDKRHGGQFPSEAPPDNPDWDNYKDYQFCVVCRVGDNEQIINSKDIPQDDEAWDILLCLVKEFLAREILKNIV